MKADLKKIRKIAEEVGFNDPKIQLVKSGKATIETSIFGTIKISKTLLCALNKNELKAILYHEIAHHKLKHLTVTPTLTLLYGLALLWLSKYMPIITIILGIAGLATFATLAQLQELEADLWAYCYAGEDLIKALIKIYRINKWKYRLMHPSLEERLKNLGYLSFE